MADTTKSKRAAATAIVLAVLNTAVAAQSLPEQWQARPGLSAADLIKLSQGKVVSTDALTFPDGRSALILYIDAKGQFYRCTDFMTAAFQSNGYFCFELVSRSK